MKKKKNVERGGVIPYYVQDGEIYMMFMKPSDPKFGGKEYQIAKGKLEKGETPEEGAFREAKEELGLFGPNVLNVNGLGKFGKVHMFIAKIKDPNMFGDTTTETHSVVWWTPQQFQTEGRYWQKPIVKAAARKIRKIENLDDRKRTKTTQTVDRHSTQILKGI